MTYNLYEGVVNERKSRLGLLAVAIGFAIVTTMSFFSQANAVASYSNGFETDTVDWSGVTRVASGGGNLNVVSNDGSFHGEAAPGAFTRWNGYENVFPTNGYVTEVDLYVDMAEADGTDKRLDFSSAINNPAGSHRRDFIIHLGTDPTIPGQWFVSASNNSPGWPGNPARNPATLTETGWYTLRHQFNNVSGVLSVDVSIVNDAGTTVGTWTLSDPSDVIGSTVGGNRYGWFVNHAFGDVAIDNVSKKNTHPLAATSKDDCKNGGWMNFQTAYKNQGQCVSSVVSNKNN